MKVGAAAGSGNLPMYNYKLTCQLFNIEPALQLLEVGEVQLPAAEHRAAMEFKEYSSKCAQAAFRTLAPFAPEVTPRRGFRSASTSSLLHGRKSARTLPPGKAFCQVHGQACPLLPVMNEHDMMLQAGVSTCEEVPAAGLRLPAAPHCAWLLLLFLQRCQLPRSR